MEYFILICLGILPGLLAAILATLPGMLSLDLAQALANIGKLLLILLGNGVFWISIFIQTHLRDQSLTVLNVE